MIVTSVLKNWISTKKQSARLRAQHGIDSLTYLSDWEMGIRTKISLTKSVIYIPLKKSVLGLAFFYDHQSNTVDSGNLVSVKDLSSNKYKKPIEAIETYYHTVVLKNNLSSRFTGSFTSYSITNNYQYDYGFKNGNILWRGFVAPKLTNPKEQKIKSNRIITSTNDCELWGHFTVWLDGSITLGYVYLVCSDCQTTSISIKSGDNYITSNCSGSGGYNPYIFEIWNLITNPCISRIVDNLVNSTNRVSIPYNKPTYTDVLSEQFYNIFGGRDYFHNRNIVFAENNAIPVEGRFAPSAGYSYQYQPDTIYLNTQLIGSEPSQEYVASIVLHEMAHAIINHTGQQVFLSQHAFMASQYVDLISLTLRQSYPNLDHTSANSMALQGLGFDPNTSFFASLITNYGFNNNGNNENDWTHQTKRHQVGEVGKKQCQ